jgi:cytochrome c oxidase assembly protein subunit 15
LLVAALRVAHGMTRFQKIALTAFVCVELLIFVGAVVRATGSGLGCPDWPFCYGCWVPPQSAAEIDRVALERDLPKFRLKAERLGRDPQSITVESLVAEFDPVSTWVEYINRLTSLPVGLSTLALLIACFGQLKQGRPWVCFAAVASFFLVLANAWLGRNVVVSGLRPGIITLHMALAILLQCALVFTAWAGCATPWRLPGGKALPKALAWLLFGLVIAEGIMGSQVRELTDTLAKTHAGESRSAWITQLEGSTVYLVHRSFSWLLVGLALGFGWRARKALGKLGWLELSIPGIVLAQMILGVVLAHLGVYPVVQVLHIGLSSLLVSGLSLWLLGSSSVAK